MMLHAEKACVPKTTNTFMWSTNLEVAKRAIRYWNMKISEYKNQKGNKNMMLQELIADKVINNNKTVQDAQQQRVAAWKHLRTLLRNHKGESLKDLQTKVKDNLAEGDI